MNLSHKLALVTLLATATGLSAQSDNYQTQDIATVFTLSEFANAPDQEKIVTELLQNRELSDEKIAQMLEVPVTEVTRARTYFGPREVKHLAQLAATGYRKRCYKYQFFNVCIPTAALITLLAAAEITAFTAYWFWCKSRSLQHDITELKEDRDNFMKELYNTNKELVPAYYYDKFERDLPKQKTAGLQPVDSGAMGIS